MEKSDEDCAEVLAALRKLQFSSTDEKPVSVTAKAPPALKYKLPKHFRSHEYYQCIICLKRKKDNSFSDHFHSCKKRSIRWFCPICKKLFSPSYRSRHISKVHADRIPPKDDRESMAENLVSPVVVCQPPLYAFNPFQVHILSNPVQTQPIQMNANGVQIPRDSCPEECSSGEVPKLPEKDILNLSRLYYL